MLKMMCPQLLGS